MLRAAAAATRRGGAARAAGRAASTHHVGDDADALADIINRHVAPTPRRPSPPILTTRSEALALYRAILRATAAFTWPDTHGRPWRDALRESARREFDQNRSLADPEAVARALVVGRDALARAMEKLAAKAAGVEEERRR